MNRSQKSVRMKYNANYSINKKTRVFNAQQNQEENLPYSVGNGKSGTESVPVTLYLPAID